MPAQQFDVQASGSVDADRRSFDLWLAGLRAEATARGIRTVTLDRALSGIEPAESVIERDRSQPETILSPEAYLARRLTAPTLRIARAQGQGHRRLLSRVSARYGVPGSIVLAVWGLESNFGRFSGVRPTIAALATLAYDDRRAELFRGELLSALEILDGGFIELERLKGSWAGAMGQAQFLPSSYLRYAEDFDGDGHRDIWDSEADVFASIANYLKEHGWTKSRRWGREVRIARRAWPRIEAASPMRNAACGSPKMSAALPIPRWRQLGVRTASGGTLPQASFSGSLVRTGSRSFLVYSNYDALLAYNCSHAYALSVGVLADRSGIP